MISLGLSVVMGVSGLQSGRSRTRPLGLIEVSRPMVYASFGYAYATIWLSTPVLSVQHRVLARVHLHRTVGSSDAFGAVTAVSHLPDSRGSLSRAQRKASPQLADALTVTRWLAIPERRLYTGRLIVGAIGTGKTSACMYPYVEQLVGYRAHDSARKIGGLILEVKGDFCRHVRDLLARHGRAADSIEVSLASPSRYNPLHHELDAYALAYGIATLMTNLFGRGKEPFGNKRARTW